MLLERAFQILRSLFEASLGYSVGRFLTTVDFLRAVDLYREVSEISLGNVVEEVPEVVPPDFNPSSDTTSYFHEEVFEKYIPATPDLSIKTVTPKVLCRSFLTTLLAILAFLK
jgi:hypothetical protein